MSQRSACSPTFRGAFAAGCAVFLLLSSVGVTSAEPRQGQNSGVGLVWGKDVYRGTGRCGYSTGQDQVEILVHLPSGISQGGTGLIRVISPAKPGILPGTWLPGLNFETPFTIHMQYQHIANFIVPSDAPRIVDRQMGLDLRQNQVTFSGLKCRVVLQKWMDPTQSIASKEPPAPPSGVAETKNTDIENRTPTTAPKPAEPVTETARAQSASPVQPSVAQVSPFRPLNRAPPPPNSFLVYDELGMRAWLTNQCGTLTGRLDVDSPDILAILGQGERVLDGPASQLSRWWQFGCKKFSTVTLIPSLQITYMGRVVGVFYYRNTVRDGTQVRINLIDQEMRYSDNEKVARYQKLLGQIWHGKELYDLNKIRSLRREFEELENDFPDVAYARSILYSRTISFKKLPKDTDRQDGFDLNASLEEAASAGQVSASYDLARELERNAGVNFDRMAHDVGLGLRSGLVAEKIKNSSAFRNFAMAACFRAHAVQQQFYEAVYEASFVAELAPEFADAKEAVARDGVGGCRAYAERKAADYDAFLERNGKCSSNRAVTEPFRNELNDSASAILVRQVCTRDRLMKMNYSPLKAFFGIEIVGDSCVVTDIVRRRYRFPIRTTTCSVRTSGIATCNGVVRSECMQGNGNCEKHPLEALFDTALGPQMPVTVHAAYQKEKCEWVATDVTVAGFKP